MSYWMRSGTLQVGPYRYNLDDLVYEFEVPFEDSEQLMVTKITIYNLSESTRNAIQKNQPIIINAGYREDIGVIFVGKVSNKENKHQGTEWITTLKATEAMEEWLSKKVNKTYAAGIDAASIVRDLLNIFGIEVSRMELAVNKVYPRGKVCNGPVRGLLKEIITSDCKSIFLVRHGQVIIRDPRKGTNMGVLLSPRTGLLLSTEDADTTDITAPQDTQKTGEQKAQEQKTIKRRCLLNYRIAPGDTVRIEDETLKGEFIVKKGSHNGSRRKDWLTYLEVVPA